MCCCRKQCRSNQLCDFAFHIARRRDRILHMAPAQAVVHWHGCQRTLLALTTARMRLQISTWKCTSGMALEAQPGTGRRWDWLAATMMAAAAMAAAAVQATMMAAASATARVPDLHTKLPMASQALLQCTVTPAGGTGALTRAPRARTLWQLMLMLMHRQPHRFLSAGAAGGARDDVPMMTSCLRCTCRCVHRSRASSLCVGCALCC